MTHVYVEHGLLADVDIVPADTHGGARNGRLNLHAELSKEPMEPWPRSRALSGRRPPPREPTGPPRTGGPALQPPGRGASKGSTSYLGASGPGSTSLYPKDAYTFIVASTPFILVNQNSPLIIQSHKMFHQVPAAVACRPEKSRYRCDRRSRAIFIFWGNLGKFFIFPSGNCHISPLKSSPRGKFLMFLVGKLLSNKQTYKIWLFMWLLQVFCEMLHF